MELIKWDDKFATGISGVDHEHEELIASINAFGLKLKQDSTKNGLVDILNNIYATIHSHFMLEEKVMKKMLMMNMSSIEMNMQSYLMIFVTLSWNLSRQLTLTRNN